MTYGFYNLMPRDIPQCIQMGQFMFLNFTLYVLFCLQIGHIAYEWVTDGCVLPCLCWELNWASVKWHDLYPEEDATLKEENKNFELFLLKMKELILFKYKMQLGIWMPLNAISRFLFKFLQWYRHTINHHLWSSWYHYEITTDALF